MGSKILFCGCNTGSASSFQDTIYGKGNRVFTMGGKAPNITFSCTCCSRGQNSEAKKKK